MAEKKKKKIRWSRYLPIYAMALPGLLYLFCNNYLPMFGIVIAFKKLNFKKGIWGSDWCGFNNFKFLFQSSTAWVIIRNTILYNIGFIIIGTIFAVAFAIFLNEIHNKFASRLYQTLILLPYLISWVIVSYLVFAFLSSDTGLVNNSILSAFGLTRINWYSETKYWPFIIMFVYIWKATGYSMIIYYSSIVGISQDYYEAARIDGATKWQQIKRITLPLLKPTIITMFILSVGHIFNSDFGLFYQVPKNSGVLYNVTQTIDVYVYNALMKNSDYGMSSAASVFQSVVGFVLVIIANKIIRKTNEESALF
jgi:putative aldouronate transport system permease protein